MKCLSAFERLAVALADRTVLLSRADAPGQCWHWDGSKDAKGYGFISVNGKTRRVHIVAFELATGRKLRPGHTVEHECKNTSCWRPSHLDEITRAENTARGNRAKPRSTEKARRVRREMAATLKGLEKLAREPAPRDALNPGMMGRGGSDFPRGPCDSCDGRGNCTGICDGTVTPITPRDRAAR